MKHPAIPTEFKDFFEVNTVFMQPGWYAVKVNEKGIECMTGHETKFSDFETCKKACDIHNETACGMSVMESAVLYAQRRFND